MDRLASRQRAGRDFGLECREGDVTLLLGEVRDDRVRACERYLRQDRAGDDGARRGAWRRPALVEDRRPRSRLVDGHTHTHSVLTTQGLHLRSFRTAAARFCKNRSAAARFCPSPAALD